MTITNVRVTDTDRVLAEMLTENTGSSFLDSGGAYGRNWERNQGNTAETYLSRPAASIGYEYVSLDVFHWLRDRLEFDPEMDRRLELWTALRDNNDPWLVEAETFAAAWQGDENVRVFNSYNDENCLSQDIQWVEIGEKGEPCRDTYEAQWVLLQIHGGCDARGGYTRPRVFRVTTEAFGYDYGDYSLYCDHDDTDPAQIELFGVGWHETRHYVDVRGGAVTDRSGMYGDPWQAADIEMWVNTSEEEYVGPETDLPYIVQCPYCAAAGRPHAPMAPEAPYAS